MNQNATDFGNPNLDSSQKQPALDPAPHRGRCGLTTAYDGVSDEPTGRAE